MNHRALPLVLALLLGGCSKSSTEAKVVTLGNMAGSWSGKSGTGFSVAFTITDSALVIHGTGTLAPPASSALNITISGTRTDTTFSLSLINAQFLSAFYTGVIRAGQLHGFLNNSGFSNETLNMTSP